MNYQESVWHERFKKIEFTFEDRNAMLVLPEKNATPYWVLKTEYCEAFPNLEEEMLLRGVNRAFLQNHNRWGTDDDLDAKARFATFLKQEFGFYEKCVPVGMSCGGLHAIKQAAHHPEMVSCVYLDAPVVNYFSYPFGYGEAYTNGRTSFAVKQEVLNALQMDMSGLIAYRDHPLDCLPKLIKNRIPCVLCYGEDDKTVAWEENSLKVIEAYKDSGIDFKVIAKPGCDHHPHGLDDPAPIADFIMEHLK